MARQFELYTKDDFKSADLYANVLRMAPDGMTLDVMQSRMDIIKKLDGANGSIILEDAEWRTLHDALKGNKWPMVHEDVLASCDAVAEAEEINIEKAKD